MKYETFTIDALGADRLGPANAEQRSERKAATRSWLRRVLHVLGVTTAVVSVGAVLIGGGALLGASQPDEVMSLVPPMPSPSGERAETRTVPEHIPGLTLERSQP